MPLKYRYVSRRRVPWSSLRHLQCTVVGHVVAAGPRCCGSRNPPCTWYGGQARLLSMQEDTKRTATGYSDESATSRKIEQRLTVHEATSLLGMRCHKDYVPAAALERVPQVKLASDISRPLASRSDTMKKGDDIRQEPATRHRSWLVRFFTLGRSMLLEGGLRCPRFVLAC